MVLFHKKDHLPQKNRYRSILGHGNRCNLLRCHSACSDLVILHVSVLDVRDSLDVE